MSRFADSKLSEFLAALASNAPTPGGGTAAAIAGAMGASLLMMVGGLPKSRTGTDDERVALAEACATLASIRDRLIALADDDTAAYNRVIDAYRLPKATDADKDARKQAIQLALKGATTVPLDTLRAAAHAIEVGVVVATHGNRSAASDVGVGLGLLQAAADGAHANVKINLESVQDEGFRSAMARDATEIATRISAGRRLSEAALAHG